MNSTRICANITGTDALKIKISEMIETKPFETKKIDLNAYRLNNFS